uniref:Uncharacterized protein n=1 Tax=Esox lucius TaxID=8010 RepID=A0AAY5KFQ2_ESOLU
VDGLVNTAAVDSTHKPNQEPLTSDMAYGGDVEANRQEWAIQNTEEPVVSDFCCWSVLNTIFCCWPLGIGALCQSKKKLAEGDIEGAKAASDNSLCLNVLSLIFGVIFLSFYVYFKYEKRLTYY